MAKYRAARSRSRSKVTKAHGAIPCIVFLVSAMALLMLLFYSILKPK
ncbi:MAG: hypothetical protein ABSH05_00380 [Bryobacteraceae bacterium]